MPAPVAKVVGAIKSEAILKPSEKIVKDTILHFGAKLVNDLGGPDPFSLSSKAVKTYLKNFAGEKITGINRTTQARVKSVLVKMNDEGKSTEAIAKVLSDKFDQWGEGRAYVIAQTEINSSSNFGAHEGMVQAGVEQKEWLATDDDVVRDTHQELDGQIVDIDDTFEIDGMEAMYPGDFGEPEMDVNCRCGVLPVVNDKALRVWRSIKALNAERKPFDRKMTTAFAKGFRAQKAAVLAALAA